MHGVINFLKPPGMTSHDAVAFVRRVANTKRVGHTGTLDPAAAGVLPICIGQATRLVEYLQEGTKEYIAEITFGYETDTLDAMGEIVSRGDASDVSLETLCGALDAFRGTIEQTPPIYSAIKQGGKKLYELAREGCDESEVEIKSRNVKINQLHVTRFFAPEVSTHKYPRAMLHIECSGGTYIRSLVRDIGRALGCFATMTFLVRTRNGAFSIDGACTPEQFHSAQQKYITDLPEALKWCAEAFTVDDGTTHNLSQGRTAAAAQISRFLLEEYRQDADMAKNRATKAWRNRFGMKGRRVLFLNSTMTVAALAILTADQFYKAEKVFFLDSHD